MNVNIHVPNIHVPSIVLRFPVASSQLSKFFFSERPSLVKHVTKRLDRGRGTRLIHPVFELFSVKKILLTKRCCEIRQSDVNCIVFILSFGEA